MGIQYGNRTPQVISARNDDVGIQNAHHELDVKLGRAKADIVCIQDTHNAKTEENVPETNDISQLVRRQLMELRTKKGAMGIDNDLEQLAWQHRTDHQALHPERPNNAKQWAEK